MGWLRFFRTAVPTARRSEQDRAGHPTALALETDIAPPTSAPTPAPLPEPPFLAVLLGVVRLDTGSMAPPERRFLEQIDALRAPATGASPLLPRLPVVLPQLMRLVRLGDAGPRVLADCLARDPVLVGEVVRLANAGRLAGAEPMADLSQAVARLGERGLTQLVTRVALRPVFASGQGSASAVCGPRLWVLAERGAEACVLVSAARGSEIDPFQAYLAGLVANVGAIAALRHFDLLERHHPLPTNDAFYRTLQSSLFQLSGQIARQWQFPEPVCRAVEQLADPVRATDSALTVALRTADAVTKLLLLAPDVSAAAPRLSNDAL